MSMREFEDSDVNTILKMPEIEYINTLLALVNLTDREKEIINSYYFKGLKDSEIAEHFGLDTRQVSAIKKIAKNKMLKVWKNNTLAIALSNLYNKNNS